jgi:tellurium resistance protein TerD
MALDLKKEQRVALDKGMAMAWVGLGWDTNRYDGGESFDLDVSCFLVGENGKVNRDEDFIFYNNLKTRNGSVVYVSDNRTGAGEGDDDEVILVTFGKVPEDVKKIVVCVTIHEAEQRKQNFGQVSNAYVRVSGIESESDKVTEVLRFDLAEDFSVETALVACEIYRHENGWNFNAVAAGYRGGLAALCRDYGLDALRILKS